MGLIVAPQLAFFASYYPDKAWEYPVGRSLAAMLILDYELTESSWVTRPDGAGDLWQPDKTKYPNEYRDGDMVVHTRFERDRGSRHFFSESMYGFWVPGNARDALLGIVLGGPQDTMRVLLEGLQGRGSYTLGLVGGETVVAASDGRWCGQDGGHVTLRCYDLQGWWWPAVRWFHRTLRARTVAWAQTALRGTRIPSCGGEAR